MKSLEKHSSVFLLFACLIVVTFFGVGNPYIFAVLGIVLCMAGLIEGAVKIDLWMFIPMVMGVVISAICSYRTYSNILEGYTVYFALYPVMYMMFSYLDEKEGAMLRKLCVLWCEVVAGIAFGKYIYYGIQGISYRVGGILGNPNSLGIFLVLAWFTVLRLREEENDGKRNCLEKIICFGEPLLLVVLMLTLSMGSFLALAVGFIVYTVQKKSIKKVIPLIAQMGLYLGTGLLLCVASREQLNIMILILLYVYIVLLCINSKNIKEFLEKYFKVSAFITATGVLGAGTLVMLRPSAPETFIERLEMMRNGWGYFMRNPLFGVGPFQWRMLNYADGDKYFNTWHIHNIPIHMAVEFGIFAVLVLVIIFTRVLLKKENRRIRPAATAFIVHNLMDTSFFYFVNTSLLMLGNRAITGKEKHVNHVISRILYIIFGIFFVYAFMYSLKIIG